ncbi:MAG: hypothetical protein AAF196_13470 [Planctomycetota bacterium]
MKTLRPSLLSVCAVLSLLSLRAPLRAQQGGGPAPNLVVVLMTGFLPGSNPGLAILNTRLQTAFGSQSGFASQVFTFNDLSGAANFVQANGGSSAQVVLVGHSFGAEGTFLLTENLLEPAGVSPVLCIPLDFVSQSNPLGMSTPTAPTSIAQVLSYHQISTGLFEPEGSTQINGADRNINVEVLFDDTSVTHTSIDCDERVQQTILNRIRELVTPNPFAGTDEDLDLLVRINTPNVPCDAASGIATTGFFADTPTVAATGGDLVTFRAVTPEGDFNGSLFGIVLELFPSDMTPLGALPGVASSLSPTSTVFFAAPLAGSDFELEVCWPMAFSGVSVLGQVIVVDLEADNGLYATSNGVAVEGV